LSEAQVASERTKIEKRSKYLSKRVTVCKEGVSKCEGFKLVIALITRSESYITPWARKISRSEKKVG
jgi:hypothetical protein